MKYIKLITKSDKKNAAEQADFRNEESSLQIQSDILATKRALSKARTDLVNYKGAYPFNTQNIIDAQIKVEKLSTAIKKMEKIQKELF